MTYVKLFYLTNLVFVNIFSFCFRRDHTPKVQQEPRVDTVIKPGFLPFKSLLTAFLSYSHQSYLTGIAKPTDSFGKNMSCFMRIT